MVGRNIAREQSARRAVTVDQGVPEPLLFPYSASPRIVRGGLNTMPESSALLHPPLLQENWPAFPGAFSGHLEKLFV